MRKLILTLLISAMIAACDTNTYPTAYNLDFEYKADAARPTKWSLPDALYHSYATCLDLEQRQHGASSLRMVQTDSTKSGWAIFSLDLPTERVASMYFWTRNTREMLDLVEWMRRFNQPEPRITYTGFDMQGYAGSMELLRGAFTNNRQATLLLEKIEDNLAKVFTYSSINGPRIDPTIANTTTNDLQQLKSYIDKSSFSKQGKSWIDALNFRHVGAVKIEQEFPDHKITETFDYLLFIRQSIPSHLL